jgi:hypothetical protein
MAVRPSPKKGCDGQGLHRKSARGPFPEKRAHGWPNSLPAISSVVDPPPYLAVRSRLAHVRTGVSKTAAADHTGRLRPVATAELE